MIETLSICPGVTLRCYQDHRFKQGRISLQLVRPMCREEVALNALVPMVLLRGTRKHPDLRAITMHLDDLYGATVGDLVRRIGDYQTTGFYCGFTEDRFAMTGDAILAPVVEFLGEILLQPKLEDGIFCQEIVQSEKRNLICDLEAQRNDKASYASGELIKVLCRGDSFAIPRLGEKELVAPVTAEGLYQHYQKILREAPVEIFYVGAAEPEQIAGLLKPLFDSIDRHVSPLPPQTALHAAGTDHIRQEMDISQSRLCLGYVTPITNRTADFAAMQVMNTVLGSGMTSKLFQNIREKMSLCYSIGSGYYGSKGILTVSAGIDADKEEIVRSQVEKQLDDCRNGCISEEELQAAREAVLSSLRGVLDSPGAIEGFFATSALSGLGLSLPEYRAAVERVTREDVAAAAGSLRSCASFFLKGVAR